MYPPAWKRVGVGQTISFSTSAIDQELDETAVTVTKLPASAKFDAITQTITWTPTTADRPAATFEVTINQPGTGLTVTTTFSIAVDANAQPVPVAPQQSAAVEALFVIREPARLAQVNKDWPLDKLLLEVGADTFKLQFSDAERAPSSIVKRLERRRPRSSRRSSSGWRRRRTTRAWIRARPASTRRRSAIRNRGGS